MLGVSVDSLGLPESVSSKPSEVLFFNNQGFRSIGLMDGEFSDDLLRQLVRDIVTNVTDSPEFGPS